jgi:hypothetical protein
MSRTLKGRLVAVVVTCLVACGLSVFAQQGVVVVRAESVDAVMSDLQRTMTSLGVQLPPEQVLGFVFQQLGVTELSWLDKTRPLALVLPMQGLQVTPPGIVAVVPVSDAAVALGALGSAPDTDAEEDTAVVHLVTAAGTSLFVMPSEDYLVVGLHRQLVADTDAKAALELPDLPPGSLAIDIFLEPIAPLVQMGLINAKQMVKHRVADGAGEEGGEEPRSEEETAAAVEAVDAVVDLYSDLLLDLLNNTRRLQISLELGEEHMIVHGRMEPREGSTMAGLLEVQSGGLPDIARYIDSTESVVVFAGQMKLTPAFVEASNAYVQRFASALAVMQEDVAGMAGVDWLETSTMVVRQLGDRWVNCYRGDVAGSVVFDTEIGIRMEQISGTTDAAKCGEVLSEVAKAISEASNSEKGTSPIVLTENALEYRGVRAMRQEMNFELPEATNGQDDPAREITKAWLEAGSMVAYTGLTNDVLLTVAGSDAEERFKHLVDRVSDSKSGTGIEAGMFAPLQMGPGFYGVLDFGKVAQRIAESEDGAEGEDGRSITDLLGDAGRLAFGARLETGALHTEFAMPLFLFDLLPELTQESEDESEAAFDGDATPEPEETAEPEGAT